MEVLHVTATHRYLSGEWEMNKEPIIGSLQVLPNIQFWYKTICMQIIVITKMTSRHEGAGRQEPRSLTPLGT